MMIITESKIAIIGSRTFNNYSFVKSSILKIIQDNNIPITKILSGGSSGVDTLAKLFADKYKIPFIEYPADWSTNRKSAGVIRNSQIINNSDVVIAFWDGKSKGTKDSIDKAKRAKKRLFIVDISTDALVEGVFLNSNDELEFNFKSDTSTDIMTLQYNKNLVNKKIIEGVKYYYSYRLNKNVDSKGRSRVLHSIKDKILDVNIYEHLLSKAVLGLFNNPTFDISDVDVILIPKSSSSVNLELALKIKNKLPNAKFVSDVISKMPLDNITLDYNKIQKTTLSAEKILWLENLIKTAVDDNGNFSMRKIVPVQYRKFVINFLKLDISNREILNSLVGGKILLVDDILTTGTTLQEIKRIIYTFSPSDVILYTLIGI